MAKQNAVELNHGKQDADYRTLLCSLACDQDRVGRLTDSLTAKRQQIIECEAHIRGLSNALRSEAEGPTDQQGTTLGPRAREKERAGAKTRLASLRARLPVLQHELAAGEKELAAVYLGLAAGHKRRRQIEGQADAERRAHASATVEAAATTLETERKLYREAREKAARLSTQHRDIERSLNTLMARPAKREEVIATNAKAYLQSETLPEQPQREYSEEVKKVLADERTVREAVLLQSKVLMRLEREYGDKLAAALRPAQSEIAERLYAGATEARNATIEADLLRVAFAVELGSNYSLGSITCPSIPKPYMNSEDAFVFWADRMRREGLLV
jgi:hypothetical protein